MVRISKSLIVILVVFGLFGLFLVVEGNKGLMNVTSFVSAEVTDINDEYATNDLLSGSALIVIEPEDFLLKDDKLKLSVNTTVPISKEVTMEQFMSKVTTPATLVTVDGKQGYKREGDGMIPFMLETVFGLEIREEGLNFNLTLEYISGANKILMVSKMINVSAGGADVPLIEDVVFSVMDKDGNFVDKSEFFNSQNVGCFAKYFNAEDVKISILGPGSSLEEPYILFDDPVCVDEGTYAGYCGNLVNITSTSRGDWTCYVSITGDSSVGDTLSMNNTLPKWIGNFTSLDLDSSGKVLDNVTLDLNKLFSDLDKDVLEYVSKKNTMVSVKITDGVVSFVNAGAYTGGDVVEFIASDGYGEASSGSIILNIGSDAKKCVSDLDCLANEICNYNVCMQVTDQVIQECVENWNCLQWSACSNGVQSRTCTDLNSCGSTLLRPDLVQGCTSAAVNTKQTVVEESTVVKPVEVPEQSNIVYVIVIVLGSALMLGGGVVYFWKRYNKKLENQIKEEKPVGTEVKSEVQVNPIESYIKEMLAKGYKIEDAKKNLVASGWDPKQVQKVSDLFTLKNFIIDSKTKGFTDDVIRKSLESKGWGKELLDEVFSK